MIDKFIKINTATGGPVLINAADIASVINKVTYTQINVSNHHWYRFNNPAFLSGTHSIFEVASGTTTADGTGGYPGQVIDSNASFTSAGILPGDKITDQATPPQQLDSTNPYDVISNIIVDDTTLNTQGGLASGVAYKIYSSNKIYDPSADFVSSGVQIGDTVGFSDGFSGSVSGVISAVTANTLTLQREDGSAIAQTNDQILFSRANDPNLNPITYSVFKASEYDFQTAINAAIADVVNNTSSHVVEVPIVSPGLLVKNM